MTDSNKKRVIFLYSANYSGHYHAAYALEEALLETEPSVESRHIEAISFALPKMGKLIRKAYYGMVEKTSIIYDFLWDNQRLYKSTNKLQSSLNRLSQDKFKKLYDDFKPDVAICTQAFPCGIMSRLKQNYASNLKIIGVITDYAVHSYWVYNNVDLYTVASERMKNDLMQKGIEPAKVKVTGIPVYPKFKKDKDKAELEEKFSINNQIPTILIMGGSHGIGPFVDILKMLDKMDERLQSIVVCGRNKKLKKRLSSFKPNLIKDVKIFDYVDNIDEMMTVSDILITKPGGITITEALTKKIPMIIYNAIRGQESENYSFLVENNAALQCRNLKDLKDELTELLQKTNKKKQLINNSSRLSRPNAASEVIGEILKRI
jgi:processive 1,2-diacylglycerol beta-glucosyltransferase